MLLLNIHQKSAVGQRMYNLLWCFRLYIRLKKAIIYHIDLSSHSLKLFHQVLDIDMFSIDSTYDLKFEDFAIDERMDLYRCLKKEGVGITVMKAFCGGKL